MKRGLTLLVLFASGCYARPAPVGFRDNGYYHDLHHYRIRYDQGASAQRLLPQSWREIDVDRVQRVWARGLERAVRIGEVPRRRFDLLYMRRDGRGSIWVRTIEVGKRLREVDMESLQYLAADSSNTIPRYVHLVREGPAVIDGVRGTVATFTITTRSSLLRATVVGVPVYDSRRSTTVVFVGHVAPLAEHRLQHSTFESFVRRLDPERS